MKTTEQIQQLNEKWKCTQCNHNKGNFYEGVLGYETFVCSKCEHHHILQ